jgi:hypothetical protein
MTDIEKRKSTEVQEPFEWRTRKGELLPVSDMTTGHLFHTFKMIWNNFMPREARVHPVRIYSFPSFYTQEYMKSAVKNIYPELISRSNLSDIQIATLREMEAYFLKTFREERITWNY